MYTNVYRSLKWIIEKFMEKKYLTLEGLNELWVKEEDWLSPKSRLYSCT